MTPVSRTGRFGGWEILSRSALLSSTRLLAVVLLTHNPAGAQPAPDSQLPQVTVQAPRPPQRPRPARPAARPAPTPTAPAAPAPTPSAVPAATPLNSNAIAES